jgi:hypothetical protein
MSSERLTPPPANEVPTKEKLLNLPEDPVEDG